MARPVRFEEALLSFIGGAAPAFVQSRSVRNQRRRQDEAIRKAEEKEQLTLQRQQEGMNAFLQMVNTANQIDPERITASGLQNILNETTRTATMAGLKPDEAQKIISNTVAFASPEVLQKRAADQFSLLQEQTEFIERNTKEFNRLNEQFDLSGLSQEELQQAQATGSLPLSAIGKVEKRISSSFIDPFTRSLLSTRGSIQGKAEAALEDVQPVVGDVLSVFDLYDNIPDQLRGPVAGRVLGGLANVAKLDPNLSAFEDTKQLILAGVAKSLGREVGVLTDKDVNRVKTALPDKADTDEIVLKKKIWMYNFMDRRVRANQRKAKKPETGINMPPELRFVGFNEDMNFNEIDIGKVQQNQQNTPSAAAPQSLERTQQDAPGATPNESPNRKFLRERGLLGG